MENSLTYTLQQVDALGQTLARRQASIVDTAPTVGEFRSGVLPDTNQATITLPLTQPRQVHLRNTHASAKITVVWTQTGGSQATVLILGPNDVIAFWHENTGNTYGISSFKLTSDTAGATYELFIGG